MKRKKLNMLNVLPFAGIQPVKSCSEDSLMEKLEYGTHKESIKIEKNVNYHYLFII